MKSVLTIFAELIPQITTPLSLTAFTVFVIFFLLIKILLKANIFPTLTKQAGLKLLNKIFNLATVVLILIIIFSFISYIYIKKIQEDKTSRNMTFAETIIAQLEAEAANYSSKISTTSRFKRLVIFQPYIYKLSRLLNPEAAYDIINSISEKYQIPEITPALLCVSDEVLNNLLESPFHYLLPEDFDNVTHPLSIEDFVAYEPPDVWSLAEWGNSNEYKKQVATNKKILIYLFQNKMNIDYRDIVLFLKGKCMELIDKYPDSFLADAAIYVTIRSKLIRKEYESAIVLADEFISRYPKHRHCDDATALKVVAHEAMGKGKEAFFTALEGKDRPDSDMTWWFDWEIFRIAERILTKRELESIIHINPVPEILFSLKYTLAHHEACDFKYEVAHEMLVHLRTEIEQGRIKRIEYVELEQDIEKIKKIIELRKAKSLQKLYELGLLYYDDELVHYNQIFAGNRGHNGGNGEIIARTPEVYYIKRNNYYIASEIFKKVAARTDDLDLKQKALYKLARCYQHLSYSSAFYFRTLNRKNRKQYANECVNLFFNAFEIFKNGNLADDCLAEAGFCAWYYLGNATKAINYFKMVLKQYPHRNAVDNSWFHLARIYFRQNDLENAQKAYKALIQDSVSKRWIHVSEEELRSPRLY